METANNTRLGKQVARAAFGAALLGMSWLPAAKGVEYAPYQGARGASQRSASQDHAEPALFTTAADAPSEGSRLRIRRVNHQGEGLQLTTPTGGWEEVKAPPARYGEESQPPRYPDHSAENSGPRGLFGSGANTDSFPDQRPIPVRQPMPMPNDRGLPMPGGLPSPMGPRPLPGDNFGGTPGPLNCDDLNRFFDPTPFAGININISVEPGESRPPECPLPESVIFPNHPIDVYSRHWSCLTYSWKASALCHKPLYFEEMAAERYGHSWGYAQPVVSGAHFFGSILLLPYQMGVHPPGECIYPLGYYRPGDCAPKIWYQAPLSIRGALSQAAAVTGLVYVLP